MGPEQTTRLLQTPLVILSSGTGARPKTPKSNKSSVPLKTPESGNQVKSSDKVKESSDKMPIVKPQVHDKENIAILKLQITMG